ncbi:Putative ATP-dependent DNA helicase YjcD [Roseimaritima multifibrata]|uniref:DNA 3'-5' helicase n=1 Tax=Roseimaritima multifibrata TaxID=1930274 RepID=A0A517MBF4_9BACT|nr:UvrD-helicase domain-containing protein [Roseimaritima multifibrata]QDS92222.1 Putative ATP-dependent DNA helicase YjcD [Roseimaritima multifibrata]
MNDPSSQQIQFDFDSGPAEKAPAWDLPSYAIPEQTLPALLVRASAGTGKTYRLTGRLLHLLLQGAPIESLLATTFTRKAAGEILERLLSTLASAADDRTDKSLLALQQQIGRTDVTRQQCTRLLHAIIREIHRLRIGTLDSLFSQLARSFPFELGLPPGWRLTDENEERWLRSRAIHAMLSESDLAEVTSLLAMLTKGEIKRSIAREIEMVIVDTYAVARGCSLAAWEKLQTPSAPENQTLTESAGLLLTAQVGHKSADKQLHAIGELMESREIAELAGKPLPATVKGLVERDEPVTYYKRDLPESIVSALLAAYDWSRSHTLGLLSEQSQATGRILQDYDHHIHALKQSTRALAFDDVAQRLSEWIDKEDLATIAYRLDGAIEHVLLDEFQDTSPQQWKVLRPLAYRAALESQKQLASPDDKRLKNGRPVAPTFFCVGDTKQAIYSWRGGVAAIFDSVAEQIPGVTQDEMSISYRSSPVITDAVTQIFQNLSRHPLCQNAGSIASDPADASAYEADAIQRFNNAFPDHESAGKSLPGYVCLQTGPEHDGPADEKSIVLQSYVAAKVAELAESMPGRSIGILTRKNATVARLIYLLRARGVEVSQEGGNPLVDSGSVELLLSALMLSEHPGDGRWWYHVRNSPLAQHEVFRPHAEAAEKLAAGNPNPQDWSHQASIALTAQQAGSSVRRWIEHRGLVVALRELAKPIAEVSEASDQLRMRQLLQLAQQFERNPQPRLSDFVDQVRQQRVERPQPAQVRVMTVHQAKGLEFDAVVLPELEYALGASGVRCVARRPSPTDPPEAMLRYLGKASWRLLPEAWQRAFGAMAAGSVTETLCLLYVSVTRPRHGLYMFVAPTPSRTATSQANAKMLLYNALQCDAKPADGETVWFETGDPLWYQTDPAGSEDK